MKTLRQGNTGSQSRLLRRTLDRTTNQDEVYYIEQAKEWQEAKEREDARNQYLTSILVQHGIAIPEGYATHDSNQLQNGMAASDAAYYMQGSSEAAMPKN